MRLLARQRALPLWIGLVTLSLSASAGEVLHERFDADPAEDFRLGATTPSGSMPAVVETRSGLISAPDEEHQTSLSKEPAYGGSRTPTSADAAYHLDRLTTRPDRVQYDEPFRPSVLPFKRLYAFDLLKADLSFKVARPALESVSVGGDASDEEDTFFADFEVDLVAGVPVRIPSVGPGARIRALHADPPQPISVLEDSAENWFARAETGGRARLVMQLSIARMSFGSQFLPVGWPALAPYVTQVSGEIRDSAQRVAAHIGVSQADSPARAMILLVQYFRKFHESAELPIADSPLGLYEEVSVSQKGVCRHRAYAFAVTALVLGLPVRLVHNEAHAWVEIFDTKLWHRVDLGGAASNIQESQRDPLLANYRPPSDPYTWPQGSTPGLNFGVLGAAGDSSQSAPSSLSGAQGARGSSTDASAPNTGAGSRNQGGRVGAGSQGDSAGTQSALSRFWADRGDGAQTAPEVVLIVREKKLLRGRPLSVSGTATREGKACALTRIDVFLGAENLGSVATDSKGEFRGQVTVPLSTQVGRVSVTAEVAGGCE